jgi:plasmid stability protein
MGQVLRPDLDHAVTASCRDRAQAKGRSLEAELREVLTKHIRRDRERLVRELDELRSRQPPWQPGWPTAVEMIREDRDAR